MRFTTRPIDPLEDPLRLNPTTVWMAGRTSLWGWGGAAHIHPGAGIDRFEILRRQLSELVAEAETDDPLAVPGTGPVALTSITFASGSTGSLAVVPEVLVGNRDGQWWITSVDDARLPAPGAGEAVEPDRARFAGSSVPDVLWLEAVATAIQEIEAGALDKVVLARDYAVWSRRPFPAPALLAHLRQRFPGCYVFRVGGMVGASPELLVRREDSRVESVVLAGSAPSYADPVADRAAAESLQASAKDRWEHDLAVRSVSEKLADLSDDLEVSAEPDLLRLDNVQHLATYVTARLPVRMDTLAVAALLHPTAAVGGTPTAVALEVIRRLEGMDRGRYAGPVGWVDCRGDGELAIALRCAELSGARARLFAGAGVVAGSLPEAELEETRLKLGAMMGALGAA